MTEPHAHAPKGKKKKIGVFLCHCGKNIAGTVDIPKIAKELQDDEELVVMEETFLCSEQGQENIKEKLKSGEIDRVVIASCSPVHHGDIFSKCVGEVINPFMWDMANIREQCSWVYNDMEEGTPKAKALIKGSVNRVRYHEGIGTTKVPMYRDVVVVGGGITGCHTALELVDKDFKVHLIEKESNIGGNMVKLDRTFPTDDCSMCTISPILNAVVSEENIVIHTMSTVEDFKGRPGDYKVKIKTVPRKLDEEKCTGCGACTEVCPVVFKVRDVPKPTEPEVQDKADIDAMIEKNKHHREPLIPVLLDVNEKYRYLPKDVLHYLAYALEIPISEILRIATFYKAFSLEPKGFYHIKACLGTACHVRSASAVVDQIDRYIEALEQDPKEPMFSLETVNCLGACAIGPVIMINEDVYGDLDQEKVIKVLDKLKDKEVEQ